MTDMAHLGMRVDSTQLISGKRHLKQFGEEGARAFSAVTIAAGAALAAFASIARTIDTIQEFDRSMAKLEAITGANTLQMQSMRDVAKDLGATTEYSAKQAADGLTFLGMAGFSAAESIASIPAVLDLATAAGIGLAEAADTASNIMSGFAIPARDAATVADILAATSSKANTNVSQLGQAMSTVAPIAAALGFDLADTAAAIGVMSDAGIQSSRAGTAMRGVLASLAGPTKEATDVLKTLGLTISDVDPAINDLAEIMKLLGVNGLTTAQAMSIFGREAASGALVLVKGAEHLDKFGDELRKVDGAAADMAGTIRDTLGGDIDSFQSSVSGLMLALGEAGLTAILRGVIKAITIMTRGMTGILNAVGGMVGKVVEALSWQETATDNLTIAMGDELTQANKLFQVMGQGITMSQSAALAKLSEAEGHMRTAHALQAELEANVALQVGTLELSRIRQQAALDLMRTPGDDLEQMPLMMKFAYEEAEQSLISLIKKQDELRAIVEPLAGDFAAATAEVERIREAIRSAEGGMVTFDGEVVTAIELTERFKADCIQC